jgi:hypothetical protein
MDENGERCAPLVMFLIDTSEANDYMCVVHDVW